MSNEFQGGSVNYSGCSYSTLCNLDEGQMAPVRGVPSMSCQVVPTWKGRPSYDTLSHGVPACQQNCGGHFSYKSAYPWPCKTQYMTRPCASGCPDDPTCNGGTNGGTNGSVISKAMKEMYTHGGTKSAGSSQAVKEMFRQRYN